VVGDLWSRTGDRGRLRTARRGRPVRHTGDSASRRGLRRPGPV